MDKENILNKYIDLIDKGYCSDCNELNCIDNFPHAKITHAIRELQHENQKQKEVIDKAIEYLEQKPVVMVNGEPREIYVEDDNKLLDILKKVE